MQPNDFLCMEAKSDKSALQSASAESAESADLRPAVAASDLSAFGFNWRLKDAE